MWTCEDCGWDGPEAELETEENEDGGSNKFCPDCGSDDLKRTG